ncbi:asparaginase [Pseudobacteroides cellulosolvens]|uniref:L-asparaginase II n=1 Tax=Pseudobacteroides cellulosolvens ATCC 35603 = DSM 2933 TaxID=398512 RepID=A0A0L6JUS0_9FIRM|nr:asparaginase [Pseudobacteroides cellulosolvens]KNY29395.1 L-asparaginase II [Pseudobacteroides cellulosolvens ATCC 35603 = DSM 2933]
MHPLVVLTRTNRVESIHKGYVCITDSQKKIKYHIGNPDTKVYFRSSAKPIQAVALVNSGAIEKFSITLEELAIICSSHSGEDFHREAVSSILNKVGLSEENLSCGVANPYNQDIINQLIKNGERPSQLYNCCSGKHAGMLALCKHYNFPIEGYTEQNHPVQQLILKTFAELLDCNKDDITTGIDGCNVPTYMIAIHQISFLYSLLAQGSNGTGKYNDAFGVIQKAMSSFPRMVNGDKEFCTDLIMHSDGKVIGKVGAEGIYCVAVPEKQLGICIKISDGNERGVYPVTTHILDQLEVLNDEAMGKLRMWSYPPVKNHKGIIVGYTVPVFDLTKEGRTFQIGDKFEFEGENPWNH